MNADRLDTMLQQLGHVKTLAQCAMHAAKTSPEAQPLAKRQMSLYRSARAHYGAARKALGAGDAPAAAAVFDKAVARVASIERAAVEESQR